MSTDILIIGAGINGLLSALNLANEGLSVTLVERGDIGRESTWAGAGILSPLLPWDYDAPINALTDRGRALWPELAAFLARETRIDPEYWPCGMLALGDFDPTSAMDWCQAHGWSCAPTLPDARPIAGKDHAALWLPQVAQARNPRVAKALEQACRDAGVRLVNHQDVLDIEFEPFQVRSARTRDGKLLAGRYIIASGAWSGRLLGEAALGLDITPIRGQILLFKAAPGLLPHIVYSRGKYLVPRKDGHILVGSTLETAGFDKSCTDEARQELLNFALNTLPDLHGAELVYQWAGLRPGSPGNLPTISRHPELSNLYLNSGHFRYGVTMAPASAELLTELLLERPTTLDPAAYAWPHA